MNDLVQYYEKSFTVSSCILINLSLLRECEVTNVKMILSLSSQTRGLNVCTSVKILLPWTSSYSSVGRFMTFYFRPHIFIFIFTWFFHQNYIINLWFFKNLFKSVHDYVLVGLQFLILRLLFFVRSFFTLCLRRTCLTNRPCISNTYSWTLFYKCVNKLLHIYVITPTPALIFQISLNVTDSQIPDEINA
jgi:hypothetical protein